QGFAASNAYDLLRQLMAMQNVERWVFMVNQLVLLALTTGLIAGAIWRARRHVERAVQAEVRTRNLGRYFSPQVAAQLAETAANRLEGMTQQYDAGVLLSRETIEAAERFQPLPPGLEARLRDLGPLPIAGHEAPVHVFALSRKAQP